MSTPKPLVIVNISALCLVIAALVFLFLAGLNILWTVAIISERGINSVPIAFSLGHYRFPTMALIGLWEGFSTIGLSVTAKILLMRKGSWERESWHTFRVFWSVVFIVVVMLFSMLAFLLSQALSMWALI